MRGGELRHRIVIQYQPTPTQDSTGNETTAWATFATVYAQVKPFRGAEGVDHASWMATVTHEILIRYRAGVNPVMRIVEGTHTYNIKAVLASNKPTQMTLMAEEIV